MNNSSFIFLLFILVSSNIQQIRTININLNHHLEFLGMKSLQKLGYPSLLITGNPRLCYVDTIDWTNLLYDEPFIDEHQENKIKIWNTDKLINIHDNNDDLLTQIILHYKKDSRKKRPLKDSTIFIGGNAHLEFCSKLLLYYVIILIEYIFHLLPSTTTTTTPSNISEVESNNQLPF